jgi:hypothetical protein
MRRLAQICQALRLGQNSQTEDVIEKTIREAPGAPTTQNWRNTIQENEGRRHQPLSHDDEPDVSSQDKIQALYQAQQPREPS